MAIEPDKLRERLTPEVKAQLLRENWASHDARWYLKVGLECGFAVANKLNKDAVRSIGRTEIKRLLEATQSSEIKTAEDFIKIQKIACEVYFPPPMLEGEIKVTGEDSFVGITTKCYGFEEVRKAGGTKTYECACGARHEGWLAACGLKGEVRILRSMMQGDPVCEISISSISPTSDDDKNLTTLREGR